MKAEYKACRHNGKRMRKHRAIMMMRLEGWGWDNDSIQTYMGVMIVHHINGDKTDNRRCNLRFMSASEHSSLHSKNQKRKTNGRFA